MVSWIKVVFYASLDLECIYTFHLHFLFIIVNKYPIRRLDVDDLVLL